MLNQIHHLDQHFPDLSERYTMSITNQWRDLDHIQKCAHVLSNSELWQSWNLLQHYIEVKAQQGDAT